MHAIILAGGRGKRLRPVTDYIPKPLVAIKNIPIIEWQIKYLKKFGVKSITICTGYKTEMLEYFFDEKKFNLDVKFSIEKTARGTGGAIKKARKNIQEDAFLVLNGDIITDIDLKKLIAKPNSIAAVKLRTKFGILETENEKITKFNEKKELENIWMNAGIYYLEKSTIKDLPQKGDIEKTLFPEYAAKGKLNTVKFKGARWYSIDSFKDMEESSSEVDKIIK